MQRQTWFDKGFNAAQIAFNLNSPENCFDAFLVVWNGIGTDEILESAAYHKFRLGWLHYVNTRTLSVGGAERGRSGGTINIVLPFNTKPPLNP